MTTKTKFEESNNVCMEGSWGATKAVERTMVYRIGYRDDREYGWFEVYDKESSGDEFYGGGGLWFTDNELVDYDGVGSLSSSVLDWLADEGFDVTSMT